VNIFVTSSCPVKSANFLDNKRMVKMALESTQLLCTALNLNGVPTPYKTAHPKHPCTIWTAQSQDNFIWLWGHAIALCNKYKDVYGKTHACEKVLYQIADKYCVLPKVGLTPFVNCTRNEKLGIDYRELKDVYLAYQLYLSDRWENDVRQPEWG
jgi:hypothetical protein